MKIGFWELLVVFIVALLLIGPDKLPAFAQKLGAALRKFREASSDVSKGVRENVIEPLEEAQKPIQEAIAPLQEVSEGVKRDFEDVEKSLRNIGKPAPKPAPAAATKDEAGGLNEAKDEATGGLNEVKVESAGTAESVGLTETNSEPSQSEESGNEGKDAAVAQEAETVTPVMDDDISSY